MPEFRRDPTTGAWTIIAAERAARPGGRAPAPPPAAEAEYLPTCPFCPGNEAATPPEILRLPAGAARWSVRVVPNKYPALSPDPAAPPAEDAGLLARRPARGHHEVIVEGPVHRSVAAPPDAAVLRDVFLAARERCRVLSGDPGLEHVALFKNHGKGGGASLTHPHWQLVASPLVPPAVARELHLAAEYHARHRRVVLDDVLREELRLGTRVVEATEAFVVLAAFAPQWMGETWIVPRLPGSGFDQLDDAAAEAFAGTLWRTLRRVGEAFDQPALNVVLHSGTLRGRPDHGFRWHARIQPRLSTQAGYELGSGMAIVSLAPEAAAEALRGRPPT